MSPCYGTDRGYPIVRRPAGAGMRRDSKWLPLCLLLKFQATLDRWLEGPRECLLQFTARASTHVPRPARQTVLLVQRKDHVDRRVDFDRLEIEKSRLIAPLTNGVERRLLQERVAGNHFQLLNRAILADDGVQADRAGNASLAGQRRINGLNAIDDARGLHVAADADGAGWFRLRRRRRADSTDYAAKHAAHRTTGDAARHPTDGAYRTHIRFGIFLNDLDVFRN